MSSIAIPLKTILSVSETIEKVKKRWKKWNNNENWYKVILVLWIISGIFGVIKEESAWIKGFYIASIAIWIFWFEFYRRVPHPVPDWFIHAHTLILSVVYSAHLIDIFYELGN